MWQSAGRPKPLSSASTTATTNVLRGSVGSKGGCYEEDENTFPQMPHALWRMPAKLLEAVNTNINKVWRSGDLQLIAQHVMQMLTTNQSVRRHHYEVAFLVSPESCNSALFMQVK